MARWSDGAPSWQSRRSALNHDWLRSAAEAEFGKWENILRGRIQADGSVGGFRRTVLERWAAKAPEIRRLATDFELAMSPAVLFAEGRRFAGERHAWLESLVVALWKRRHRVDEKVHRVLQALEGAESRGREMETLLAGRDEAAALVGDAAMQRSLAAFRDACRVLSDAITEFPSRLLVV